ncbi:copper-translocating P-type ATPase [Bradyrhizobium sp. C9]|uniref:copper-translocating P-type ATPase n=1 Tax=Bradyrhizobium sp. C9 TaxID=142585 RepID=UPI001FDFA39C|nr:copper-translocating P-type ATPase [Bradyrhizobium sp. C9]
MKKIGRKSGLIGYDNDINIRWRMDGKPELFKPVRPRTLVYAFLITVICAVMVYELLSRTMLDLSVLHDRNPMAVRLSDGSVRNAYTVRLLNRRDFDRVIAIDIDGPPKTSVHVVGADSVTVDRPMIVLATSVIETIAHAEHAYFDAAIMLIAFLLAGRYLDQNMRRRTRAFASNLAALKAETAAKFVSPTEIRTVPVAAIKPGDIVLVRPGECCTVDGNVIEGSSEIDQSLITGETLPVIATPGSAVFAGTLVRSGTLRVRVAATSDGTLLAQISWLLDHALQARSRYLRLAERASRLYAPIVHITALLTMLGWLASGATFHDSVVTAIAVLIITCPCALGLAIPAVQTVAAGALFRSGVLLNAGDASERIAEVDRVILDKTGTLTLPELDVANLAGIPENVVKLAGRLALSSRHPVAAALARAAGANEPLADIEEEPGRGVRGYYEGAPIRLGRPSFCGADSLADEILCHDPEASVVAYSHGEARHVFAIRQRMRPDAVEVATSLARLGIMVEIVFGDREPAVRRTAETLGIHKWRANVSPTDKVARVEDLTSRGYEGLMVGDGLNDAPALAAAHASMSPVTATHMSQAVADAIFLGEHLGPVIKAVIASRGALRLMRQNLCLAVVYNVLAVPVAIAGLVTPLIAAAAMSCSSVLVMLNALRARRSEAL